MYKCNLSSDVVCAERVGGKIVGSLAAPHNHKGSNIIIRGPRLTTTKNSVIPATSISEGRMRPHNHEAQNRFCEGAPCVILGGDNPCRIGTAAYDPSMDPGYPPDNALPDILRNEMQLLLHLDSLRHAQVQKVIDVAVAVWQGAENGAVASAAELVREEGRAKDWETSEASTSEKPAATNPSTNI